MTEQLMTPLYSEGSSTTVCQQLRPSGGIGWPLFGGGGRNTDTEPDYLEPAGQRSRVLRRVLALTKHSRVDRAQRGSDRDYDRSETQRLCLFSYKYFRK